MSTMYSATPKLTLDELRERLPDGVTVHERPSVFSFPCLCLTDGKNFVWALEPSLDWLGLFHPEWGVVRQVAFERFGGNKVTPIFDRLRTLGLSFTDEYGIDVNPGEEP